MIKSYERVLLKRMGVGLPVWWLEPALAAREILYVHFHLSLLHQFWFVPLQFLIGKSNSVLEGSQTESRTWCYSYLEDEFEMKSSRKLAPALWPDSLELTTWDDFLVRRTLTIIQYCSRLASAPELIWTDCLWHSSFFCDQKNHWRFHITHDP